jgi:hypothetical protein
MSIFIAVLIWVDLAANVVVTINLVRAYRAYRRERRRR